MLLKLPEKQKMSHFQKEKQKRTNKHTLATGSVCAKRFPLASNFFSLFLFYIIRSVRVLYECEKPWNHIVNENDCWLID